MDKAHKMTDERLAAMENRLRSIYLRADKEIQKTADEYFKNFLEMDKKRRSEVEAGKLSKDDYTAWRRSKLMYSKRYADMRSQVAEELLNVNKTAQAYINGELPEVYSLNYNALDGMIDGYSFTLTDPDTVRLLAEGDPNLLPYKYVDGVRDIRWNSAKVDAEILQGILQGNSIPEIAARLSAVTEMNHTSAVRNARTTVTAAENRGRMDSYTRAEKDGVILQKKWIATNDSRTRHWHQELDGQIVDVDQPFENVVWLSKYKRLPDKIMYPGDPAAHPCNVYNCRCTIASVFKGFRRPKP